MVRFMTVSSLAALSIGILLPAIGRAQSVRSIVTLEGGTTAPFTISQGGQASSTHEHASAGRFSLRLDRGYAVWDAKQDWSGYDFFEADVFNASTAPVQLYIEVHDRQTKDYWTRVNYNTVLPPGNSTLTIPTDLYVGEKARPGRPLDKSAITVVVLSIGDSIGPVFFDRIRLEQDQLDRVEVPGLRAFSFGPASSHTLGGFTSVNPATVYSAARGYGLKNSPGLYGYDVLQPDPLYERGLAFFSGGFQVDVPNGKYHVFINLDNPSGFWGEYQVYRKRSIVANGIEVVHDTVDLSSFIKRYFRFADVEDSLDENTFDKYQRAYFHEKEFDVEVVDGHIDLEFSGDGLGNSVSALILYPASESAAGRKYLRALVDRRRFYFDNYFHRIPPTGNKDSHGLISPFQPTASEQAKGYAIFARNWMDDVPVNAVPRRSEVTKKLSIFASAGQMEPVVFSILPSRDIGKVSVSISDLVANDARIPGSAVQPGIVSHRLTRVTPDGAVYTILPRLILPRSSIELKKGIASTFWLTFHVPRALKAGLYRSKIRLAFANGVTDELDLETRLFATPLKELDVPAGPWGSTIDLPWFSEDLGDYNRRMYQKCLTKIREYGCTTFTGIPTLRIKGWKDGNPDIDFSKADEQMSDAKAAGFRSMVVNYNGGIQGFDNYHVDDTAMKNAGFTNYVDFLRSILSSVDNHAKQFGWLPVAYNLCDEPVNKEEVDKAVVNAEAWRRAAPEGILTTGATSIDNPKPDDLRLPLVKALKIPNLNNHDAASIQAIQDAGNQWAFYNGGSRWTFGTYMFKAAHEYGMKFRLSWHWNASAGDPYYALDCREDDYAWCVTNARGELIPTIHFDREIRAGIDDYRYMETLALLLKQHPNHPSAPAGRKLLTDKLSSFKLGDREHNSKWPSEEFQQYRLKLAEAIERLSGG